VDKQISTTLRKNVMNKIVTYQLDSWVDTCVMKDLLHIAGFEIFFQSWIDEGKDVPEGMYFMMDEQLDHKISIHNMNDEWKTERVISDILGFIKFHVVEFAPSLDEKEKEVA
tara:strand:- start:129 stop:464 length:336 start_codon:yes stop_codon:yes gene_type:complete